VGGEKVEKGRQKIIKRRNGRGREKGRWEKTGGRARWEKRERNRESKEGKMVREGRWKYGKGRKREGEGEL